LDDLYWNRPDIFAIWSNIIAHNVASPQIHRYIDLEWRLSCLRADAENGVTIRNNWGKLTCNIMSKIVAVGRIVPQTGESAASLYAFDGARKYLNGAERRRALAVMASLAPEKALFALTLAWTGARVSEVLALTPASFQIEQSVVAFRTLKRRKLSVREMPVPPALMSALELRFGLVAAQRDPDARDHRLWCWHRVTAWRLIKKVMAAAQVAGRRSSPRGLRHGFGVGTLQAGVPLNLVQRWLGHARISTTAIYADACGPDEQDFAARFWRIGAG
jgi:integrase/recombinase XerD